MQLNRIDPIALQKMYWPKVLWYDRQVEIIYSVEENDETVVTAGNKLGKDYVTGFICLCLFLRCIITNQTCRIVTTSVAEHHLTVLWGEIGRFVNECKLPLLARDGGPLAINHMEIRRADEMSTKNPLSYLVGRVSKKGEGLAGHHAEVTLGVGDEACHDSETEVLTESGWMLFSELTGQERLLSMDPVTRIAEYLEPTAIINTRYKGPMYLYERRSGNFCVTPNHRMLLRKYRAWLKTYTPYHFEPIGEVSSSDRSVPRCFKWIGESPEKFTIKGTESERKLWSNKSVDTKDWMKFLGWFCSEGHYEWKRKQIVGVNISQKEKGVLLELEKILGSIGLDARIYEHSRSGNFCLRLVHRGIAEHLYQHCVGRYCWEKRVPAYVGNMSSELIEVFLQAYTEGDGYVHGNRDIIYTSSPGMADDLQVLSYKAGRECSINKRELIGLPAPRGISRHDGFMVGRTQLGLDSHLRIKLEHLKKIDYDGWVHCANVPPHHTLFTRRNGVCMWSGNSGLDNSTREMFQGWAKRCLWIGNPNPCVSFFHELVEAGDMLAPE